MIRAATLALCLAASPALATQEYILPTLFDVTGVAADDVLNIRAHPNASAEIIGTLTPDATGIEVVEQRGNWGRVNTSEQSGWVSLRYLNYRTDVWAPGALPAGFTCQGTEPFWSLRAEGDTLIWDQPEGEESYSGLKTLDDGIFRSPRRALIAGQDARRITAMVEPALCSDGMSDRSYGLSASVIVEGASARDGAQLYTGCCLAGGVWNN
ncbi:MAG: SH3 domain-containing protein [Paracoccus sp. (in: a-proteobacteria)]|nr:SH3 domain-containing protein [Paracoccus sp. (in: a-proteobacteria)]